MTPYKKSATHLLQLRTQAPVIPRTVGLTACPIYLSKLLGMPIQSRLALKLPWPI